MRRGALPGTFLEPSCRSPDELEAQVLMAKILKGEGLRRPKLRLEAFCEPKEVMAGAQVCPGPSRSAAPPSAAASAAALPPPPVPPPACGRRLPPLTPLRPARLSSPSRLRCCGTMLASTATSRRRPAVKTASTRRIGNADVGRARRLLGEPCPEPCRSRLAVGCTSRGSRTSQRRRTRFSRRSRWSSKT